MVPQEKIEWDVSMPSGPSQVSTGLSVVRLATRPSVVVLFQRTGTYLLKATP